MGSAVPAPLVQAHVKRAPAHLFRFALYEGDALTFLCAQSMVPP